MDTRAQKMLCLLFAAAMAWIVSCGCFAGETACEGMSRTFRLKQDVVLSDLNKFQQIEVWVPVPKSNDAQTVEIIENSLPTGSYQLTCEHKFGNTMLHFTVDPALKDFSFRIVYDVLRREWKTCFDADSTQTNASKLSDESQQLYLQASRLVPTRGKPLELLPNIETGSTTLQKARALYNRVDSYVAYDKSNPGYGHGDVHWVCDSRTGNCTDFHSLFISLARSQQIPARFEIGLPLPPERGMGTIAGYHCWAWFYDQELGWTPVDISEADKHPELKEYYFGNLTENRVGFSVGRDIVLEPPQAGPELNYFVYPYVEADGKPLGEKNLTWEYEYEDR